MSDMKKMGVLGPLGTHSEAAAQYLSRLLPERPQALAFFKELSEKWLYDEISASEQG